jgi:hypothetical protein
MLAGAARTPRPSPMLDPFRPQGIVARQPEPPAIIFAKAHKHETDPTTTSGLE